MTLFPNHTSETRRSLESILAFIEGSMIFAANKIALAVAAHKRDTNPATAALAARLEVILRDVANGLAHAVASLSPQARASIAGR